jgi:hypothetical protein
MARKPYVGRLTPEKLSLIIIRRPLGVAAQAARDLTIVVRAKGGLL